MGVDIKLTYYDPANEPVDKDKVNPTPTLEDIKNKFSSLKAWVVGLTATGAVGIEFLATVRELNVPTYLVLLAFPVGVGLTAYSRLVRAQRNSEIGFQTDGLRGSQNDSAQSMNGT